MSTVMSTTTSTSPSATATAHARYASLELDRFRTSFAVLSTIIRAQYLFRASRRAYKLRLQAKRNKQKRQTELGFQEKLRARLQQANGTTPTAPKFSPAELEARAASLHAEIDAKRAAQAGTAPRISAAELSARASVLEQERAAQRASQAVVEARAANPALAHMHADLSAVFAAKQTKARAEQLQKCQSEFLAKLEQRKASAGAVAARATAGVVRELAADPMRAALSKEVRFAGEQAALKATAAETMRARADSALVHALNTEIKRPDNLARLRSAVSQQQETADAEMQRRLRRGTRRTTHEGGAALEWKRTETEVVHMDR